MTIETVRLRLRPWAEEDAEELYRYARDPQVGPAAGWPPHTGVENSREVICGPLSAPETYAMVMKTTGKPVGCAGLLFGENGTAPLAEREAEIGYWVGVPFWGQGLAPEATAALLRRCFMELDCRAVWCCSSAGNEKSRRVWEKCGFDYHHTIEDLPCPLMGDLRTTHFARMTRSRWEAAQKPL